MSNKEIDEVKETIANEGLHSFVAEDAQVVVTALEKLAEEYRAWVDQLTHEFYKERNQ